MKLFFFKFMRSSYFLSTYKNALMTKTLEAMDVAAQAFLLLNGHKYS